MKRAVIGIVALAYLSGILTLVVGYSLRPSWSPPQSLEPTAESFRDRVEGFPWVRHAKGFQDEEELECYEEILYLYTVDRKIGLNLVDANWIKDYLTEEETQALELLVSLSAEDTETALNVSRSLWFRKAVSSEEITLMEKVLALSQQDVITARNVTSSNWFFTGTYTADKGVSMIMDAPPDLAFAFSCAPWFKSSSYLSWERLLQEMIILYERNRVLAVELPFVLQPQDLEPLQRVNTLYLKDGELVDLFFQNNTVSRENFLVLSDISCIALVDREAGLSFTGTLTQDRIQMISSLKTIYVVDPEMGKFMNTNFGDNKTALRYTQKVLEVGRLEPELVKKAALFVSDNPEFVYEDRIEPYRYHLLAEILSGIPLERTQEYKNLIFVTCSVYGNRFYSWQDVIYDTHTGWSYDGNLCSEEKKAVMNLLTFLMEKNEEGNLATDIRTESYEYLYGLVDIPFTHVVKCDGTLVEALYKEQGTGFVFAIIANIDSLGQRYEKVQEQFEEMEKMQYTYSNPLVKLILEEGEERDLVFLYFCAKNWETGACLNQTLQTRMDCIVTGISTTTMHWGSGESAHIYPAYIPTQGIAEKIQENPGEYGNPFVYRGFLAPYDEAGFEDSLDDDIKSVEIYDQEMERKVCLFRKTGDRKMPAIIGGAVVVILVGVALRVMK